MHSTLVACHCRVSDERGKRGSEAWDGPTSLELPAFGWAVTSFFPFVGPYLLLKKATSMTSALINTNTIHLKKLGLASDALKSPLGISPGPGTQFGIDASMIAD